MTDKFVIDAEHPGGILVPMTAEEEAAYQAQQTAGQAQAQQQATNEAKMETWRTQMITQRQAALALADALAAGTATAAQQRQALEMCLRGIVRLTNVMYRQFD